MYENHDHVFFPIKFLSSSRRYSFVCLFEKTHRQPAFHKFPLVMNKVPMFITREKEYSEEKIITMICFASFFLHHV